MESYKRDLYYVQDLSGKFNLRYVKLGSFLKTLQNYICNTIVKYAQSINRNIKLSPLLQMDLFNLTPQSILQLSYWLLQCHSTLVLGLLNHNNDPVGNFFISLPARSYWVSKVTLTALVTHPDIAPVHFTTTLSTVSLLDLYIHRLTKLFMPSNCP